MNLNVYEIITKFKFPLCVKPVTSGSSRGLTKVISKSELLDAYNFAKKYSNRVMVQPWISGREFSVSILGNRTLPLIEVITPQNVIYDYNAKYLEETTQYFCPCDLSVKEENEINLIAMNAFQSARCQTWGRIDFIRDQDGQFWLLEGNTIPGMSEHSLFPMAAKAIGINFDELVIKILSDTL